MSFGARAYWILALASVAILSVGSAVKGGSGAHKGGGGGGGAPEAFELCRDGAKGGGFDPTTELYDWTCGLWNWSAEFGGRHTSAENASIPAGAALGGQTIDGVNVYKTATTTGGNAEWVDCTGNGSGVSRRDGLTYDGVGDGGVEGCLEDGELVINNPMADLMLAHDHTKPHGKIYVHVPAGEHGVVLVDQGCGAKLDGTLNNCPILKAPNNTHEQNRFQVTAGRRMVGEFADKSGFYEGQRDGIPRRIGVWIALNGRRSVPSSDPGGGAEYCDGAGSPVDCCIASGVSGCDPGQFENSADITDTRYMHGPVSGVRRCAAVNDSSNNFLGCNVEDTAIGVQDSKWINTNPWGVAALTKDIGLNFGSRPCVNNEITSDRGMCPSDRRITCTTDADCVAAGFASDTCTPWVDSLEDFMVDEGNEEVMVIAASTTHGTDETIPLSFRQNWLVPVRIEGWPDATCGGTGHFVPFGTESTSFVPNEDTVDGLAEFQYRVVDQYEAAITGTCGYENFSFMPATWRGRGQAGDVFGSTANSLFDCSRNDVGTEAVCDDGSDTGRHSAWSTAYGCVDINTNFFYHKGFIFDSIGGSHGANNWVRESRINHIDDSGIMDTGAVNMEDVLIDHSKDPGMGIFSAPGSIFRNLETRHNTGTVFIVSGGRGVFVDGWKSYFDSGPLIRTSRAQESVFQNLRIVRLTGGFINIAPATGDKVRSLTVRGVRAWGGTAPFFSNSTEGKGIVMFKNASGADGGIEDILFEDIFWTHGQNNATVKSCFAYLDNGGSNSNIHDNNQYGEVTFKDVYYRVTSTGTCSGGTADGDVCTVENDNGCTAGGGTCGAAAINSRMICVDALEFSPLKDADDDEGVWSLGVPPLMVNLKLKETGVANDSGSGADQAHRTLAAANAGDCDGTFTAGHVGQGAVVRINDDTGGQDCADTSGVLDGGGTASSVCACDNDSGTWGWIPLY